MNLDHFKMAYSANQLRLKVSFPAFAVLESELPPDVIIKRAIAKFDAEKKAGTIATAEIKVDEFKMLWAKIREYLKTDASVATNDVTFTIGSGAPRISQFSIEPGDGEKIAFFFSITAPTQVAKTWRFDYLRMNVSRALRAAGISAPFNQAHLFAAWSRATRGERAVKRPISVLPAQAEDGKDYSLVANKVRGEIYLVIRSGSVFRDRSVVETVVAKCTEAAEKLSIQAGFKVDFLRGPLLERFKSAVHGPEFFEVGLPAAYLVGMPAQVQVVASQKPTGAPSITQSEAAANGVTSGNAHISKDYPGKGLLQLKIDQDFMAVSIDSFDKSLYDRPDLKIDWEWISNELLENGIKFNDDSSLESTVMAEIAKKADLSGQVIARGAPPVSAKKPFIFHSYRESKVETAPDNAGSVNMRDLQQRSIVNKGSLVAEVRYDVPEVPGKDVYGNPIAPGEPETLAYTVGEGIEERNGKFYAAQDGMPKIEDDVIMLNLALVHEGDVNLRTGNIRFNGSAEIKGSIDSGSTVEVTGDLIVHGTIRDAFVRVGGNLFCKSGIVTSDKGLLRVHGDVESDFIENSRIVAGGSVKIRKAMMNSNVIAGVNIQTEDKNGVLAGGQYSARKNIQAGKLGLPSGAQTVLYVGTNLKARLAVDIRKARLEKITKIQEQDRNNLRELTRKKDAQKTKKHEQMMSELQEKVTRGKSVLEKAKAHLDGAVKQVTYDNESRIYVLDTLFSNVRIEIAGVNVPITTNMLEVMISPKRIKGSYIQSLEEVEGGVPSAEDKKAS